MRAVRQYKRTSLRICRDFGYPDEVRRKIEKAQTEIEVENILISAREKYLGGINYIAHRRKEVQRD